MSRKIALGMAEREKNTAQSCTAHQLSCCHLSVGETDEAVKIYTHEYPGCPT
jgi:hypothetical protein